MTKFKIGDQVQIAARFESRHHRVPAYVKGQYGIVKQILSPQGKPELLASQRNTDEQVPVYRVNLKQTELWSNYKGTSQDSLEIEIYEHWLEPISSATDCG